MLGKKLKLLMAILFVLSCKTNLFGQNTDLLFSSDPAAGDPIQLPFIQKQICLLEGEKKAMYGVYEFQDTSGSTSKYHLQIYDLSQISLDQVFSGVNSMKDDGGGKYHPDSFSPRFKELGHVNAFQDYQSLWGDKVLGMVNTQFVEFPFPSLPVDLTASFPVKINGSVVTGGSSENGPGGSGCSTFPQSCNTLRAFLWDNSTGTAAIEDYNPSTGSPFSSWENGIVSYAPENHPNINSAARIHVAATNGQQLFVLTTDGEDGTIPNTGEKLRNILTTHFGFSGSEKLILFDGGGSTFLAKKESGILEEPNSAGPIFRKLAFYLGFREKGATQEAKKIIVRSPGNNFGAPTSDNLPLIQVDSTFYIMYEDNFPENVNIELYEGSTLVSEIANDIASDGVYLWTPNISDFTCASDALNMKIRISNISGTVEGFSDIFGISDPQELIVNGDFECSISNSFTTDYTYSSDHVNNGEGKYFITDDPQSLNPNYGSCLDTTPNEGNKMMAINGFAYPGNKVWEQTVPGNKISAIGDYLISFNAFNLSPRNTSQLEVLFNDNIIDTLKLNCDEVCTWTRFAKVVNVSSQMTQKITIRNLNEFEDGNDFALDDISFKVKQPDDDLTNQSASACLDLIQPELGGSWEVGVPIFIRWNDNILKDVKIELVRDGDNSVISTIVGETDSDGEYEWTPTIAAVGDCGSDLLVRISQFDDPNLSDISKNSYTLLNADTTEAVPCGCSIAQNSSFEGTPARSSPPSGWSNCFGTPDTMPEWDVTVQAFDGNTYAGLVTDGSSYQEQISQSINLSASQQYDISLYLAKADDSFDANYASTAIPTSLEIWAGTSSCAENILIWTSPTISSSTWTQYSFDFTPAQNYSYLKLKINSVSNGNVLIDLLEICESDGMMDKNQVLVSNSFEIQQRVNFEDTSESKEIIAVPNPFSDYVELVFSSSLEASNFHIYDLTGKLVKSISLQSKPQTERENLERSAPIFTEERIIWYGDDQKGGKVSPGIYIYSLKTKYKKEYTGKLVYKPD